MVVSLYLDARATTGEAPVKASISNRSKRILVPMGVKVKPSQWDAENRVVKNHPRKKEINSFLFGKKSDIELELLRLERLGKLKGASMASIKMMIQRFLNGDKEEFDKHHTERLHVQEATFKIHQPLICPGAVPASPRISQNRQRNDNEYQHRRLCGKPGPRQDVPAGP